MSNKVKISCEAYFDIELSQEDILSLLMRHQMTAHAPLASAVQMMDIDRGVGGAVQQAPVEAPPAPTRPPPPPVDAPQPPVPEQPMPPAPAASRLASAEDAQAPPKAAAPATPRASRAKAAADTNGSKSAAPVVIPAEADLRALLSKVNAVHPAKIAGVVALLEEHGGHKRLNDCPTDTWPKIWQVAEAIVAAASV